MRIRIPIAIITLLILATLVVAEEHDNTAKFNHETFDYETGDYSLITDWTTVDWSRIPPGRISEVLADKLDYSKINAAQRFEMNVEQIAANLERINNLAADVDRRTAELAIQEMYDIDITISGGVNVKDGVLQAHGEKKHSLPIDEVSKNTVIMIKEDGVIILFDETKPPGTGSFVIEYKQDTLVSIDKETIELRGSGTVMNGRLHIEKDQIVTINGMAIHLNKKIDSIQDPSLPIIFNEEMIKDTDQNFVSIDTKKGTMKAYLPKAEQLGLTIKFLQGNTFIPIEPNDFLEILHDKGSFLVTRRDGSIPKINLELESEVRLINGIQIYTVFKGKIMTQTKGYLTEKGSVPLVLNIRETDNGAKEQNIIFDNHNNIIVIPDEYPLSYFECLECSEDLNKNKYSLLFMQHLAMAQPKIVVGNSEEDEQLRQMMHRHLNYLPPSLREGVMSIVITTKEKIGTNCVYHQAGGCVVGTTVYLEQETAGNLFLVAHELAHAHHNSVEIKIAQANSELYAFELQLRKKYGGDGIRVATSRHDCADISCVAGLVTPTTIIPITKEEAGTYLLLSSKKMPSFEDRWKIIAESGIAKRRGIQEIFHETWEDGSVGPRYGYIRPYGSNNFKEDIATFVEQVYGYSTVFRDGHLIQPPGHPEHDPTTYDPRYKQKLDLLLKHQFITQEDYDKIFEGVQ